MSEKLIFPIGFDLEGGVKKASQEWKNTYQKQLQKAIDDKPLKVKIDFESKGIDTKEFKQWMALSREAEKLERERIKNAKEWQKVADQVAMAETRRANATNESNARIERANRKAEASERRKKDAVERTNAAYKTQSNYLSRLFQRMVAYASVAQVFSFLRNIRGVTAEFELQRVALGSIIGDLNEANAMFEQIKAAAVKSPFQIKELVTYTKQLAAYKIETDELFETTQRLADISAGLGVSMDRLVLAYGQIRATGYLRGSEVRQLTEAGIPIVEELAKKMSDLRGETVSAAEVMGLISERAISFGMVKEVFDDMTSAGGMFYKMQEKQAETLRGQWNNLKDSIAIMYDEIGNTESVNNVMKGMIGLVKSLAENWRTVATIVKSAGLQFAAFQAYNIFIRKIAVDTAKVAKAEEKLLAAQNARASAEQDGARITAFFARNTERAAHATLAAANATTKWGKAWNSMKAFLMGNWVGLLLSALAMIGTYLYSAYKEAQRLNEELEKMRAEGKLQGDQESRNFERLVKSIKGSVKGTKEYNDAMAELKRTYGDLLPTRDDDIESLIRAEKGYRSVISAIREKITLQVKEQQISEATSTFGSDISDASTGIKKVLKEYGLSVIEIEQVIDKIQAKAREGFFDKKWVSQQAEDVVDIINSIVPNAVKRSDIIWHFADVSPFHREYFSNLINATVGLENKLKEIEQTTDESLKGLEGYAESWKKVKDSLKDIKPDDIKLQVDTFAYNEAKLAKQVDTLRTFLQGELDKAKVEYKIGDIFDFNAIKDAVPKEMVVLVEAIQTQYEKLVPTGIDQLIRNKFQQIASSLGASMDLFDNYFKTSDKTTKDWAEGIKSSIASLELKLSDLDKLQNQSKSGWAKGQMYWKNYSEEIKNTSDTIEGLKLMLEFFKDILSPKGGGKKTNPRIALLNEELSTVEKIYKEYQELRKFMGEDDARARVADMFEGVNLTMLSQALSPTEMRAQLQKALDEAKKLGDKKQILELEYKLGKFDVDEEQRKLEKSLKDLSDKLSRTKAAKEFFDRMLGLTGDKQLSATLTLSVYGEGGDVLGTKLAKQTADAFKAKYKGINFSKTAISDEGVFDWETILMEGEKESFKLGKDTYKEFLKDVDAGRKASGKRLESLMNELEKTKTYSEKLVDIYTNTQERLNTIDQEVEDDAVRKRLKDQVKALQTKEIQKLQYESFKDSPMYVAMFENLDATSTAMLTNMRNHIVKLQGVWQKLDPTQLKELQSRINEIDKQLATRNPFKSIIDGIKDFNKLKKEGSRKEDEQALFEATQKRLEAQQKYDQAIADGKGESEIQRLAASLQKCVDAENEAARKMSEWDDATQKVMQGMQNLEQVTQLVQTTSTAVNDIVEAFGGWGDAADEEFWNTMIDGINGLLDGISSIGSGVVLSMINPLLGLPSIISGIGSVFSSIGNLFYAGTIRRANKEIERQQEILDNLTYAYERLEKVQEKVFGAEYISNYEQRLASLYAQQEAYLKQAEAERSKGKKADEEKIKGYEEQARETADAIADMQSEVAERLSGTDVASAARDFAQSWIEAYAQFGNTTDAISEKFKDMIQNMIVESLAAKVMQTMLEPIFNEIDRLAQEGGEFSVQDAAVIASMANEESGKMNEAMLALMHSLESAGIMVRDMGSGLTGISKDVATASEESILSLATGINTQNFHISQVPPKLDTIIGLLRGENAMQGSAINLQDLITLQNQHLSHLPNIAQNTADTVARCERAAVACERIADQLDRVIKPRGTQATHTVNIS